MPRSVKLHPTQKETARLALERKGFLTQGKLAGHLAIALSTVSKFFNCASISVAKFEEICDALDLEPQIIIQPDQASKDTNATSFVSRPFIPSTYDKEIWYRLQEWANGQGLSGRLAAQILIHEGFEPLEPSHSLDSPSVGRDAIYMRNGEKWITAVYFACGKTRDSAITKKIKSYILGAKSHNSIGLAIVTNQELTLSVREPLKALASPLKLELYDIESIKNILDSPAMTGVRKQFLGIGSEELGPTLELQFVNINTREPIGTSIQLQSIAHALPDRPIPDLEQPRSSFGFVAPVSPFEQVNPSYMRDKEEYIRASKLYQEVLLSLYNPSSTMAEDVRLELEGNLSGGIHIAEELPQIPAWRRIDKIPYLPPLRRRFQVTPDINKYGNQWKMVVRFGNIQPGYRSFMDEPFFLGSIESEHLALTGKIFANNLPKPIEVYLKIDFQVIPKPPLPLNILAV